MRRALLVALGLVSSFVFSSSCVGATPNSGIGERKGAKGRIVGYLYDADTGTAMSGVTVETMELGQKVTATTADGLFTLDNLTASGTYRVTFASGGYVTRVQSVFIQQTPTDAYDAVQVSNVGNVAMVKPSGAIKGRVEFASSNTGPGVPIANANVILDYAGNQNTFQLTKTTTTNAAGEFTLSELPASPQGINATVCVYNTNSGTDPVLDFVPTCSTTSVYSSSTTPMTIRPSLFDLNNQDINLVQGVVRDVLTRLPLENVEVFEVGKESEKVLTDANGFYLLKTTSVNKFIQVIYRKATYAEGYQEFNVTRGQNNTNINMNLSLGGASLEGKLYYANLQPANNAEVRIDLRGSGFNVFKLVRTDAQGAFAIMDLPGQADGLGVNVRVTPWSADPDLFPETTPQSFNVTLYPGAKTSVFNQLSSNASLQLLAHNVTSGFIGTTEPLILQLSLPTVPADNQITLRDSNTGQTMPFTVTYSDTNRRIEIAPQVNTGSPLWSEARRYEVSLALRANNGPTGFLNTSLNFLPRTSLQTASITGRIASVTLDSPDIDATSRNFTLRWAPLADAFSYSVYVRTKNTTRLPSYVRLGNVGAASSPSFSVNLPGNFPIEPVAGQPFAFGQVLTFLVVPVDARGIETDASKGATLDVKDVVPPRFDFGVAQLDNATGTGNVRFVFRGTEPLDRNTAPPVTLPSGLTFSAWTVDETTGGIEGTFTVTGSVASVTSMSVQLRDTSGNIGRALAVPVFVNALVPNQGFEGTTCSMSGWTTDAFVNCAACTNLALSSQPAATAALPGTLSAFEGTCAAAFGDPDITWCGTQSMSAPVDISGTTFDRRSLFFQARFWPYYQSGTANLRLDFVDAASPTTVILGLVNQSAANSQRQWTTLQSTSLSTLTTRNLRLRLQLDTNNNCSGSRGGVQWDDFRIYVK